jgi:hypothetical protein
MAFIPDQERTQNIRPSQAELPGPSRIRKKLKISAPSDAWEPKTFGSADGWPAEGRPAGGGARCIESEDDDSAVDGMAILDCVTATGIN